MTADELKNKGKYGFAELCGIMSVLRGENGCPWDKEQTHESIRNNLIEETYEVAEAIDNRDPALLREELGDLMLQVVFHARMAEEDGEFDINDVCDELCRKLIVRHPHIFSDAHAGDSAEVLRNWEEIKKKTKASKRKSAIDGIPPSLPSLMRASKAGKKASGAGAAVESDADAVCRRAELMKKELTVESVGALLFAVANAARTAGIDAEEACGTETNRFIESFRKAEEDIKSENRSD